MGRAASGDGSIYQRKGDKRWVGAYKDLNRKRKYVYGKTQKEAREKLRAAQQAMLTGIAVDSSRFTVASYLAHWLGIVHATLKPSAYMHYHRSMRLHIIPQLGTTKLTRLRIDMIQARVAEMLSLLEASTIRNIMSILKNALAAAVGWKFIAINPCHGLKLPRVEEKERQVLSSEEAQRLLQACSEKKSLHVLITVALATGARKGELLALRWKDINWQARTMKIARTLTSVKLDGKWQTLETSPKTKKSVRIVTLPDFAFDALRALKSSQNEMRLAAGPKWQQKDLCFPNTLGNYYGLHTLGNQFRGVLASAELPPMRFHDLRHSAATILIAMGINVKVVQELLGHSTVTTTLTKYFKVLPDMQREAMHDLNNLIGRA